MPAAWLKRLGLSSGAEVPAKEEVRAERQSLQRFIPQTALGALAFALAFAILAPIQADVRLEWPALMLAVYALFAWSMRAPLRRGQTQPVGFGLATAGLVVAGLTVAFVPPLYPLCVLTAIGSVVIAAAHLR